MRSTETAGVIVALCKNTLHEGGSGIRFPSLSCIICTLLPDTVFLPLTPNSIRSESPSVLLVFTFSGVTPALDNGQRQAPARCHYQERRDAIQVPTVRRLLAEDPGTWQFLPVGTAPLGETFL